MSRRSTFPPCQCETRWLVNFGDKRGEKPVTPVVAVAASSVGLPVRLASASKSPMRPIIVPGLGFPGSDEVIAEVCGVCGFPTRIDYDEPSAAERAGMVTA